MAFESVAFEGLEGTLLIIKIVVSLFTMIYSYDVLFLHRRFKALGQVMTKYAGTLTMGIFITVGAFAVSSFGRLWPYSDIAQIIGIFVLGTYFRKCLHEFFTKPMHVQK
ncbi:hypothetical protein HOD83_01400 [Candidatus Woesearchaeota archaeon]|jgi:hypothetical protein|nr:hypothetical protein [Candidatus Woesearchaeota archaeon]MBT4114453.1 hypothetical protein [Candidatus Woesearchaeota archaeon]MBT4248227.1 hypothetical protein [Candidatus Woesearchaeota archaeon]